MESNQISKYQEDINALCLQHNVKTLFAFGSVLADSLDKDSDIDLVVDIDNSDPYTYSDNYFDLKFKLEGLFHRQVDLLEQRAIKNPFLKAELDRTKVLVYRR